MSRAIAMKMAAIAGLGMMMAALTPAMPAQAGSAHLAEVLAQMNTASRSFSRRARGLSLGLLRASGEGYVDAAGSDLL
jgi:hypothetical protein